MAISFSQLPDDILTSVMNYLPGHHVAQIRTVSTDCNRIGKNVHKHYQDAMSGKTNEYVNTRLFDRKLDSPNKIEYWSRVFASVHTNDALKQAIKTELSRLKTNEQQSSPNRQMTTEQERIVNIIPRPGTVAVVQAYAGTGKTTTLFEYAKRWRNVKILYLAYNKVLADESQEKFKDLPHVTVTTIHALAKKRYEIAIGRPIDIDNVSLKGLLQKGVPAEAARRLLSDFVRYCASDTTEDPDSPDVSKLFHEKTPHDGYLKKFQLLRPELSEFDVIMLDEVQDCTDCILDIVLNQTAACLFVGDVYQKIYGFRHVNNPFQYILNRAPRARLYYLSVSFRFGFDLMRFTNLYLRKKYNELRGFSKTLVGNTKLCVGSDFFPGLVVVCRYNISVYKLLFEIAARGMNVHVVGKNIDFQKEISFAKDLLFLQAGNHNEITSPKVARFDTLQQVQDFHNSTQNTKWKNRLLLLATYGEGLVDLWETAERKSNQNRNSVRLITAHQSKGSEYDHVMVYDDFVGASEDAHNTLYVAMTRAKKSVCISQSLLRFFEKNTPKIRYPFDTKSTNRPSTCGICRKRTTNQLVCTEDDPVSLVQGEACAVFVYTPCCKECNV